MTSTWKALQKRREKKNFGRLGQRSAIVPSVSGQLIKKLDALPEEKADICTTDQIALE